MLHYNWKKWSVFGLLLLCISSCNGLHDYESYISEIEWQSLSNGVPIGLKSEYKNIFDVSYTEDTLLRYHQSLATYKGYFFCFNDRKEHSVFFESEKEGTWVKQKITLFDMSHHNNAQFTDVFFDSADIYPLLILSKGDYDSRDNGFFVLRIISDNPFEFEEIGEVSISIKEAKNNGSWIVDTENNKLYLYSLSNGDYRLEDDNNLVIFEFDLPNIKSKGHIYLGLDNVIKKWEMPYLVHQGAVSYKGKILYASENVKLTFNDEKKTGEHIVLFNPQKGKYEAILPLEESMELEGISIFDNTIYLSYKRGLIFSKNQIVLRVAKCSIPRELIE